MRKHPQQTKHIITKSGEDREGKEEQPAERQRTCHRPFASTRTRESHTKSPQRQQPHSHQNYHACASGDNLRSRPLPEKERATITRH
ncbi:hypothetical protein Bca52824_060375 [Brassica carinata]|uniref:Uncharacterized protein n=1 Tax=Brassica carinata TaxID=52824 RepID=A0A8X7QWA7_BRACI|nr:hypothetical protein Bca52824_060375 [Brassica carinata]